MSTRFTHLHGVARVATIAAVLMAPVELAAQHGTPSQELKPAPAASRATPTSPAKPSSATKPGAPKQATTGSFSQLQAAVERIQQRVTAKVGASGAPQTAVTTPPKPADPHAKAPAEPAKKAGEATTAPANAHADAAKPAAPATAAAASASTSSAPKPKRILLSWRTTLAWPKEIAPPVAPLIPGRIGLIWR